MHVHDNIAVPFVHASRNGDAVRVGLRRQCFFIHPILHCRSGSRCNAARRLASDRSNIAERVLKEDFPKVTNDGLGIFLDLTRDQPRRHRRRPRKNLSHVASPPSLRISAIAERRSVAAGRGGSSFRRRSLRSRLGHHEPQFATRGRPRDQRREDIRATDDDITGSGQRLCELVGRVGSHGAFGRRKCRDGICPGVVAG